MNGGQLTAVIIVALVMLTGIIKSVIHGPRNIKSCGPYKRGKRRSNAETTDAQTDMLVKMNEQLDRISARLSALETIVTDEDRELKRQFQDLHADLDAAKNKRKSFPDQT